MSGLGLERTKSKKEEIFKKIVKKIGTVINTKESKSNLVIEKLKISLSLFNLFFVVYLYINYRIRLRGEVKTINYRQLRVW